MKLSSADQEKLEKIYDRILNEEMSVGDLAGGTPTSGGSIETTDDYASGDTRIPYVIGKIQTRKGAVKTSKRKKTRRKNRA